jgi:hypothetical protein
LMFLFYKTVTKTIVVLEQMGCECATDGYCGTGESGAGPYDTYAYVHSMQSGLLIQRI